MMVDGKEKPRVVFLANASNIHTKRWAMHLSARYDITILTFEFAEIPNVTVLQLASSTKGILRYLLAVPHVRRCIRAVNPRLVHVHYAGGYGLTASLSSFHPLIVSVWGSDVYIAPKKSFVNRMLLKFILNRADVLCSTSRAMAQVCRAFTAKKFFVTPFGVNCAEYLQAPVASTDNTVAIGTVKKLDSLYGIDRLIRSFAILASDAKYNFLKLVIVGDGIERENLICLAESLGITSRVQFVGAVPQSDVPLWLNRLSVYVALSRSESFGVAVLEASACGIPVVVSDAGGLPEVVIDGITGFIVKDGDPAIAAQVIARLLDDDTLRLNVGAAGRHFVSQRYNWRTTPRPIDAIYSWIVGHSVGRDDRA